MPDIRRSASDSTKPAKLPKQKTSAPQQGNCLQYPSFLFLSCHIRTVHCSLPPALFVKFLSYHPLSHMSPLNLLPPPPPHPSLSSFPFFISVTNTFLPQTWNRMIVLTTFSHRQLSNHNYLTSKVIVPFQATSSREGNLKS